MSRRSATVRPCAGPALKGMAIALALLAGTASASDVATRARLNYTLHCVGCHGQDGRGAPEKGVPSMQGALGRFLQVPGGREFIVQVPGVMNSALGDRDVADLMNWLLPQVSASTLPAALQPYSTEEISRLRASRPSDVMGARQQLVNRGRSAGVIVE